MSSIAGIQFRDNTKGTHTHVIIDLKKHGEKMKPFLEELGAVEEDEFEKKWARGGLSPMELKSHLHATIRKAWKK